MIVTVNSYVTEVTFLHKGKFVTKRFDCNRSGYIYDRVIFDPCDSYCKPPIISKSLPILVKSEKIDINPALIVATSTNCKENTLEVFTAPIRWHFEFVRRVCSYGFSAEYEADFMTYV